MSNIAFSKYHGLGNDFIVTDAEPSGGWTLRWLQQICHRHTGIGADGLLHIHQDGDDRAPRLVIYNADGSRPEMCGNGLRCVARWLVESGRVTSDELTIMTDAGARSCRVQRGSGSEAWSVDIEIGTPSFDCTTIALRAENPSLSLNIAGELLEVHAVSMGNPHAVVVRTDSEQNPETLARAFGEALSTHPLFARGANAGFAIVADDGSIRLAVYERGCGITRACGTGAAAAVAVVARQRGWADRQVPVELPGGRLEIQIPRDAGTSWHLIGPATRVFDGHYPLGG